MKLPLSLLKDFISIDASVENVEQTLNLLGIEVDGVIAPHPSFNGVVVATIRSIKPHPSADHLYITEVFDGKETFQVVCSAPNLRTNMNTAFAKIGATIYDEGSLRTIAKTSIRGVESFGMLCSATELSLYDDAKKILDLPADFPLGAECSSLLWDPILEISLTPNLGHCMSALGVARELSAAWQKPLFQDKISYNEDPHRLIQMKVENRTKDLVVRYAIRVIENVLVGPSPFWLQRQLLAAGQRPINNIVDTTNYMLLKYGQPMHAFDLDKIEGDKIFVQKAKHNETFLGLNGLELEIPVNALLIRDEKKTIAIAGVMGGFNTAVSETTQNILLEAASFDPISIRVTSKKMGLRTDSSLRFEKGVDIASIKDYLDEAAAMIASLSEGKIRAGVIDTNEGPFLPKKIFCRPSRINQVLGTRLSLSEIEAIFLRLQFGCKEEKGGLFIDVPLYRNDINEEIDLVEEVARIYGYNHIEKPLPKVTISQMPHDPAHLFEIELKAKLISLGLTEFLTCDLISPHLAQIASELTLFQKSGKNVSLLKTLHSKSEDYSLLRPSLLPGLLQVIKGNLDQKNQQFAAFELGKIHFQQEDKPIEFLMGAILLTGKHFPPHWDRIPFEADFYDLKGLLEDLLLSLHIDNFTFGPSSHPTFHPSRQANVIQKNVKLEQRPNSSAELYPRRPETLNFDSARQNQIEAQRSERRSPFPEGKGEEEDRFGKVASQNSKFQSDGGIGANPLCIGCLGELHPTILAKMDIKQKVYYAEFNANHLRALQKVALKMKPLSQFPASGRDWTVSLKPKESISFLLHTIDTISPHILEKYEVLDLYQNGDLRNVTLRFTYRDSSKTVSFEEVETLHTKLIEEVLAKTKAHR